MFLGHLVLEKTLKALFVKNSNNSVPPKVHNLLKLSQLANITLTQEQEDFFDEVNDFHVEGRYAEYKQELYKLATRQFADEKLNKIKEQYKWIKSLI